MKLKTSFFAALFTVKISVYTDCFSALLYFDGVVS